MAYVLSLRPQSPLKRSFSDNPYLQSNSPLKDPLLAPLSDITARNASACSLYSLGSNRSGNWTHGNENTPPLTSQSLLNLSPNNRNTSAVRNVDHDPRKRSCVSRPLPIFSRVAAPANPYSRKSRDIRHVPELSMSSDSSDDALEADDSNIEASDLFNLYEAVQIPLPEGRFSDNTTSESFENQEQQPTTEVVTSQPFRRWMSTLRRRHIHRRKDHATEAPQLPNELGVQDLYSPCRSLCLQDSASRTSGSYSSSIGHVLAMKATSMTVGSVSIAPNSEAGMYGQSRVGRGSNYSETRKSMDSHRGPLGPIIDERAWLRSLQRRKIVEELIASEEGYIADLKVLINVRVRVYICCTTLTKTIRTTS